MPMNAILRKAEDDMKKAVEFLKQEFRSVRTGRASPALVDSLRIEVESYGSTMTLKELGNIADVYLDKASEILSQLTFLPSGTEGFAKAEVTAGGINTAELSSKTMEARQVPGLYFIGEAVDVTGWLGGYNFQWAWSSGYCAGQFV